MSDDSTKHPAEMHPGAPTEAAADAPESERFGIVSVETIPPPDGADGAWCRYIIDVPGGALTGVRAGTRDEVVRFAEDYATQLFARARFKTKVPYARSGR